MTEFVATAAFAYQGALDLSGHIHTWKVDGAVEPKKNTTFRSAKLSGGFNRYKGGLRTIAAQVNGYTDLDAGSQDELVYGQFTARTSNVLTAGNAETEGQACVLTQQVLTQITPGGGGQIGEMSEFALSSTGTDIGVRGFLLKEAGLTGVSATGAIGTGVQAGAVGATQFVYATLHLLGTAATTITVVLESDDNSGFTTPTTRGTFNGGAITAAGGYWLTPVVGAITDTWWRLRVTAITGTWTVAGSVGIL